MLFPSTLVYGYVSYSVLPASPMICRAAHHIVKLGLQFQGCMFNFWVGHSHCAIVQVI